MTVLPQYISYRLMAVMNYKLHLFLAGFRSFGDYFFIIVVLDEEIELDNFCKMQSH